MKRLLVLILPMAILLVWSAVSAFGLVDPLFLPTPWAVGKALTTSLLSGQLARDLAATVLRALAGFALSGIIGVPLGLLIGRIPMLARATQPTIDFFRSIPATALFPLFLFAFGLGDTAKVAIVIYACSLIVLINTAYGAIQVKVPRLLCATVMGASRWDSFWKIVVPESAPGIFAGLRIALSLSFVLIVVTEMFIGTTVGLGYQIINSQMVYRIPDMYAGIMLAGVVGYLGNRALLSVEGRVLHWVGR
ncbi:MAG: ABC transporter permease [Planctomycetes bacterium]|nr:ABC transporter permease [Planctomycetota bacterium]